MNIIIADGPFLISELIVIDLSVLISKIAHPPRSRTQALGLTRTCIRTGPCSNYWACRERDIVRHLVSERKRDIVRHIEKERHCDT